MEQNIQAYRNDIKQQVKDAYGKVVYTYTTHLKDAGLLNTKNSIIKVSIIILSAVSTCGVLAVVLKWWPDVLAIVTAVVSLANLILGTYSKAANLENQEIMHRGVANRLWRIREKYLAFLTDFDNLEESKIVEKRDMLMEQVAEIYDSAPLTSRKAYVLAQQALKSEEEQYFSKDELDRMLPSNLR